MSKQKVNIIPEETIIRKIYIIRGQKVMLDFDLAALYEVETKVLNQSVKRNIDRFPEEFIFRLTVKEWIFMRSQFVTSSTQSPDSEIDVSMRSQFVTSLSEISDNQEDEPTKVRNATLLQKKRKVLITPYAFTEHGVAMLSNVLKSKRAVQMSIAIVRTFIQLRRQILNYSELAKQIESLKLHLGEHDVQLKSIYDAIENLLDDKVEKQSLNNTRKRIGFRPDE